MAHTRGENHNGDPDWNTPTGDPDVAISRAPPGRARAACHPAPARDHAHPAGSVLRGVAAVRPVGRAAGRAGLVLYLAAAPARHPPPGARHAHARDRGPDRQDRAGAGDRQRVPVLPAAHYGDRPVGHTVPRVGAAGTAAGATPGGRLPAPPEALLAHPGVRRFFQRVSLLWAAVFLAITGISMWLLVSQSLATFLWSRTVASLALTGLAIVASTWWFRRCMRATPAA